MNGTDSLSGCPAPEPLIMNANHNSATLISDNFNGSQPEHAGNYTCYVNGKPRATVEILVLGNVACIIL